MPTASEEPAKRRPGAPTKYQKTFPKKAEKLALLGMTEEQMAASFDVGKATLKRWKSAYPEFRAAITRARGEADAEVAVALRQRAMGYSHRAVKILQNNGVPVVVPYTEHYPPDTQAAAIWLYNRQPQLWRRLPSDAGGEDATPVRVVIEVKSARKRRDDGEPEPELVPA